MSDDYSKISHGTALINDQSVTATCYREKTRSEGDVGTIAVAEL